MTYQNIMLPPGIERNATPYDTPGRYWDMNLVRWQAGTLCPIGGWQRVTNTPLDGYTRHIHMYRDNSNARHIMVGTEDKLYVDAGGSFTDITPTGFVPLSAVGIYGGYGTFDYGEETYGTARSTISTVFSPVIFWSMANWGEDVIFTASSDGYLYYYDTSAPTTKPTKITDGLSPTKVPAGNTSVIVTDERHVMVTGCGGNPRRVAWSSREDYTDWNFASTTNSAGYLDLDTRTPLNRAVKVREGVLIFSQSEAFLARYVGQPYVYGIDRLADTTLINPMAVANYNGKAAWMGRSGFWKYEGGFLTPLSCPIMNDVFSNLDPDWAIHRCHACHNGAFPEIWFFYPTKGNKECNRYVVWNYMEDWWSWGSLSRTAMVSAETYIRPFAAGVDKNIYEHENGWTDAGNPRTSSVFVETGMLPITNGDRGIHVNSVLPATGHGYNSVSMHFYSRQTPEGTERTFGPYNPRSNGYTDTRITGRDLRMRIEATQDADWSVGKFRIDVQTGTGR